LYFTGLPTSPPAAPARVFGYGNNPMMIHPFAVDVKKPQGKHSNSLVAIIVPSSIMTLVLFVGVALALFLRYRYRTPLTTPVLQISLPPFTKSSGRKILQFINHYHTTGT